MQNLPREVHVQGARPGLRSQQRLVVLGGQVVAALVRGERGGEAGLEG